MKTPIKKIKLLPVTILVAAASCTNNKPQPSGSLKDSVFKQQDSLVKKYKDVLSEDAKTYPKIKDEDRKKIMLVSNFFKLVTDSLTASNLTAKIFDIAQEDTSDWKIGSLIINQKLIQYASKQQGFFYYLDWETPSAELTAIINRSVKAHLPNGAEFRITNELDNEPIDKTYKIYGKELAKSGLLLFNMDIDCDCYVPFVIKKKDRKEVKNLVNRFGFKYEEWTEEW